MHDDNPVPYRRTALVLLWAGLLAWPTAGAAQTATGRAIAVEANVTSVLGSTTTTLADTGSLSDNTDSLLASQLTGGVPSLLTARTLHAVTIGWPDEVGSEAGVTSLSLGLVGTTISADLVLARARAVLGAAGTGTSEIDRLIVNGVSIPVTGTPNQTVSVPGGVLVINEQQTSADSTVVNALHLIVYGVVDVLIGSATAGIQ